MPRKALVTVRAALWFASRSTRVRVAARRRAESHWLAQPRFVDGNTELPAPSSGAAHSTTRAVADPEKLGVLDAVFLPPLIGECQTMLAQGQARAIGISSQDVVYRGVLRSCFMTQVRRLALAAVPPLASVMVPLPYRTFT